MVLSNIETPHPTLLMLKSEYIKFDNDILAQDARFDAVLKFCGSLLYGVKPVNNTNQATHRVLNIIYARMTELSIDYPNIRNWCFRIPKPDYATVFKAYEGGKDTLTIKRSRELVRGLLTIFAMCSAANSEFDSSIWLAALETKGKSFVAPTKNSIALAFELTLIGRKAFEEKYKDISKKQRKWFEPDEKGNYYL